MFEIQTKSKISLEHFPVKRIYAQGFKSGIYDIEILLVLQEKTTINCTRKVLLKLCVHFMEPFCLWIQYCHSL